MHEEQLREANHILLQKQDKEIKNAVKSDRSPVQQG